MRIMITKDLGIKKLDDMNIVIFKEVDRVDKKTNEKYKQDIVSGYYSTFDNVFLGLKRRLHKDIDGLGLKEVAKNIEQLNRSLYDLVEELKKQK